MKKFVSVFFLTDIAVSFINYTECCNYIKYRFFDYVISLFETVKFENLIMEGGEISNPMVVEGESDREWRNIESNGSRRRIQW